MLVGDLGGVLGSRLWPAPISAIVLMGRSEAEDGRYFSFSLPVSEAERFKIKADSVSVEDLLLMAGVFLRHPHNRAGTKGPSQYFY